MNARQVVKHVCLFLVAWTILAVLLVGCYCTVVHQRGFGSVAPSPVYVNEAPPEAKAEGEKPASPSKDHVWIAGYWQWREVDETWQWEAGAWVEPPAEDYEWNVAIYEQRGENWIYRAPHWSQKPKVKPAPAPHYPKPVTPSETKKPKMPKDKAHPDHPEHPTHPEHPEHPDTKGVGPDGQPGQPEAKTEKPAKPAKPEKPAKSEKPAKPAKNG